MGAGSSPLRRPGSAADLARAREQFDAVVGPHAGLGRLPYELEDEADTEFCQECGVVLEACDEPPLCCQCGPQVDHLEGGVRRAEHAPFCPAVPAMTGGGPVDAPGPCECGADDLEGSARPAVAEGENAASGDPAPSTRDAGTVPDSPSATVEPWDCDRDGCALKHRAPDDLYQAHLEEEANRGR